MNSESKAVLSEILLVCSMYKPFKATLFQSFVLCQAYNFSITLHFQAYNLDSGWGSGCQDLSLQLQLQTVKNPRESNTFTQHQKLYEFSNLYVSVSLWLQVLWGIKLSNKKRRWTKMILWKWMVLKRATYTQPSEQEPGL